MKNDITEYSNEMQVDTIHYNFSNYLDLNRWNSYFHQIEETLEFEPKSVLIVGIGDNIVATILAQHGVQVSTFDFDHSLHPDIIGNVVNIKEILQEQRFDVLLCCQVLEHLPYENFEKIIKQFSEIANNVIISLPYSSTYFKVDIKIPWIRERRIFLDIQNGHKLFKPNKEHYWEIGYKGYSKGKIEKCIKQFFKIQKLFTAKHNHYHLFFILKSIRIII
jgi:hypothetical protein